MKIELNRDWTEFLCALIGRRVRFVLVGGHAVAGHGEPRLTEDLDLFLDPTLANARRLRNALVNFGFGSIAPQAEILAQRDKVFMLGRKHMANRHPDGHRWRVVQGGVDKQGGGGFRREAALRTRSRGTAQEQASVGPRQRPPGRSAAGTSSGSAGQAEKARDAERQASTTITKVTRKTSAPRKGSETHEPQQDALRYEAHLSSVVPRLMRFLTSIRRIGVA